METMFSKLKGGSMPSSRRGSERRASDRRLSAGSRRGSIDPTRLIRMDLTRATIGEGDFNVVFIGAGNIMFGSDEGPWNHSFRFEHKLGPRLKVVALIDPNVKRANEVLEEKCGSFVRSAYEGTVVYKSFDEFVRNTGPESRPNAFVIGSPPMFRGTTQPGRDIEMQILKHFPSVAMFIEKPSATGPPEELPEAFAVAKAIEDAKVICSVGYMLRYLKAVQMMKQIIQENNLTVMTTVARYACAYEKIAKPDWWNKARSAGPIVEQGTHFCDLSRYFGGEVDISSVTAHSLEWNEDAGKLSKIPINEEKIPAEDRIPRVTAATWKYKSGAVGSLTHVVALQGTNYSCELEVFCDGYSLKLVNPYVAPVVYIRRPGDDHEETHRFPDDDPFFSEVSNWLDTIESEFIDEDAEPQILSTFEDACKTYEFTWAIRQASEKGRKMKSPNEPST